MISNTELLSLFLGNFLKESEMNSFSDSLVPNPCLIAILLTISTHNGPQFILHYPPEPDNHDYKAASFRTPWQDFSSSSSSYSDASSDASDIEINSSDSDDITTNENSDYDVPNNYNNILSHKEPARQHTTTNNANNMYSDRLSKSFKKTGLGPGSTTHNLSNQSQKPKLTRSERNPLSPSLKRFTDDIQNIYKEENLQYFLSNTPFDLMEDFYNNNNNNSIGGIPINATSKFDESNQKRNERIKKFDQDSKNNIEKNELKRTINLSSPKIHESALNDQHVLRKGSKVAPKFISDEKTFISQLEDHSSNIDHLTVNTGSHPDFVECPGSSQSLDKNTLNQDINTPHNKATTSCETVLGFDTTFLSELLVPPRDMCNTLFELAVDDMVFLGMPVHVRHDGQWLRKKTSRKNSHDKCSSNPFSNTNAYKDRDPIFSLDFENDLIDEGTEADDEHDISLSQVTGSDTEQLGNSVLESRRALDRKTNINIAPTNHINKKYSFFDKENPKSSNQKLKSFDKTSFDSSQPQSLHHDLSGKKSHGFIDSKSDMRMFHVSFVVNPPVREFPERISQMYQCIASRFARMLRYEQAKSNYVWNEILLILEAREKTLQEGKKINRIVLKISNI